MPKLALCIRRANAPASIAFHTAAAVAPHDTGFWYTPTELADRAACETDESLLQLIPYVAVIEQPPFGGKARIFTYARGEGGEEARLHGVLSIGLGGHVDAAPPEGEVSMREHLAFEACRELGEEVGLAAAPTEVVFSGHLIYNPADAVGRVHLGVLCAVQAGPLRFGSRETGVIENGRWLTIEELTCPEIFGRLEPWSQAAVQFFGRPLP